LAGQIDECSYALGREVIDELHTVPEASLPNAIRALYQDGVVAEGAAAVVAAAIAEGVIQVTGPTVIVISGSNIDGHRLAAILTGK
jgi:threonine dehydratase